MAGEKLKADDTVSTRIQKNSWSAFNLMEMSLQKSTDERVSSHFQFNPLRND
jgi:hypothetical protein